MRGVGMGPYGQAAAHYRASGWEGTLPLPARSKYPPPSGWTGRHAPMPSWPDVQAWLDGPEALGNIGLRLPDGVIGLDVDDYGDRAGGVTLDALSNRLGSLPGTWAATARGDRSGIRLYRTPAGLHWPGQAGAGIEVIQAAHRYAVVWPSVHPELGQPYRWADGGAPDHLAAGVPNRWELPLLPVAWIKYLTELAGPIIDPADLDDDEAHGWLAGCRTGPACPPVADTLARAVRELGARDARGSRHELTRDVSRTLAGYGGEGHSGASVALGGLRGAFRAAVEDDPRRNGTAEWLRMLAGAVRLAASVNPTPRQSCDCDLRAGEGVQFDPDEDGTPAPPKIENPFAEAAPNSGVVAGELAAPEPPDAADRLIGRMLTPAQLRDHPAPAPLVDGLLLLNTAAWLIAAPGSYKSFVALDWAGHIGSGHKWMDRAVAAGPVVYVVAEGAAGMGPRIRAWEQRNGPMVNVLFLPVPVQAGKPEQWAALVEAVRRLAPVLVVLDTQARVTVGLDENDNSAMGEFVESVEQLRRASGACVLVVHHLGRAGTHARGASAVDGAQDTELRLTRTGERQVQLKIDKSKHTADDAEVGLELFVVELDGGGSSLVVGPMLVGASLGPDWRANLTLNQVTLIDVMVDIFPRIGATKAELKAEVRKRQRRTPDGGAIEPMGESAFRRAWDALVDAGRLTRVTKTQRYVATGSDVTTGESE